MRTRAWAPPRPPVCANTLTALLLLPAAIAQADRSVASQVFEGFLNALNGFHFIFPSSSSIRRRRVVVVVVAASRARPPPQMGLVDKDMVRQCARRGEEREGRVPPTPGAPRWHRVPLAQLDQLQSAAHPSRPFPARPFPARPFPARPFPARPAPAPPSPFAPPGCAAARSLWRRSTGCLSGPRPRARSS